MPKSLRRWRALYGYSDALLSWHGCRRILGGPLSWRQLLALGIDLAADEASSLLPRRARLEGLRQ
jgi:hypothetical protein